ncbi:hypothetical protein [Bradyrhizobium lablabi]|uniref:hypothetical protein n=1 Tax=Bradyrhizobium lablabi TaxID=722472 RepID=UPI00115FB1AF|nr:hypothetical protein [Bradyrhizobium lablabi]
MAFKLRMPVARAKSLVAELVALRLIDMDPAGTCQPHNWNERQYKTDITDPTTAKRSKNYRDRKRDAHRDGDRDAAVTVTVTRAEQKQRQRIQMLAHLAASRPSITASGCSTKVCRSWQP